MKLLYTPIKGYSHTVEAVIAHAGLAARIVPVPTRPYDAATAIGAANPLGTVPALVLDDGEALYGGPVIYEYLDSLHDGDILYPAAGPARFRALRQAWLADGMFDATVRLIVEAWEEQIRPASVTRFWAKIARGLDQLERDAAGWRAGLCIGQVRAVGSLAFLDLKLPGLGKLEGLDTAYAWRASHPALAEWYGRVAANPIFHFRMIPE